MEGAVAGVDAMLVPAAVSVCDVGGRVDWASSGCSVTEWTP